MRPRNDRTGGTLERGEAKARPAGGGGQPAALSVRGLEKNFARGDTSTAALGPLDLDVEAGSFVAVLGASGSGKTTLLRSIAGLIRPDAGTIRCQDEWVRGPVDGLGMVFQQPVLLDWYTVERNISLQLEVRGIGTAHSRSEAAQRLLDQVGLSELGRRRPFELSGGQQQRVSLCRALVHNPTLLLMDEPFGALDALTRERLQADLERLWTHSRPTVVFVTHDVSEAVLLADRVVVLQGPPGLVAADIAVDISRPRLGVRDAGDPQVAALVRNIRHWVAS